MKTLKNVLKTLLLPAIVYGIFLLIDFERFSNLNCLYTIFLQSIVPTITAYAISFGYICGLFDFTVGSRIIIAGLAGGILSTQFGMAGLIVGCLATSLLLSVITGLLNWHLKLPSLVLTMGLTMIFEIIGKNMAGRFSFISIDYAYASLGSAPQIIVVLVVSAAIFYLLYNYTKFSCHMKAVGANEMIAKNAGVNAPLVKCLTFVLGSLFIGIAALLTISQSGSMGAQVNLGSTALMFKPLMSVMIAIVLQPVCNLTFGIIISQVTLNTIFIGLIALGISDTFQDVVLGVFLLIIMILSLNFSAVKDFARKAKHAKNERAKQLV